MLRTLATGINQKEKLIELLNTRKAIAFDSKQMLSEYEVNERRILLIKTDLELQQLHSKLYQQKDYAQQYKSGMLSALKELGEKWEETIAAAKGSDNSEVQEILAKRNDEEMEKNWELLVNFYMTLCDKLSNSSKFIQMKKVADDIPPATNDEALTEAPAGGEQQ